MNKNIILVAVAFATLSSCFKEKEKDFSGDQIQFSASTKQLETRTVYGAVDDAENPHKQSIDWVDDDQITIYMEDPEHPSSPPSPVNYDITLDKVGYDTEAESDYSKAFVSAADGYSPHSWGEGARRSFYAMYPACGTISETFSNVTYTNSFDTGELKWQCVIPSSSTASSLAALPHGYMLAQTSTPRSTSVELKFEHQFTAFSFTLKNTGADPVSLSSFKLTSGNKSLSGVYTVSTDGGSVQKVQEFSNSVTVNGISVPGVGTNNGKTTFTIVTFPTAFPGENENDEFSNLTVTVTQGTGQNAVTKTLKLGKKTRPDDETSYEPIAFEAGKKHNISLTLPDFTNFTYTFSVTQQPVDINYAASNVAHAAVKSFRSDNTPVSWRVKGYYTTEALAEAGGTPNLDVSSWNLTGLPASGSTSTPSGTSAQALSIGHAAITPTAGTAISSNVAASINSSIASRAAVGSPDSPINLSNPNGSSDSITESANCYIVNGPGWYKIPLVMGNGVKNNTTNSASYDNTFFYDSSGNKISNLYLSLSTSSSAEVHWQDVAGLISDVSIMSTTESGQTSFTTTTTQDNKTVYWLKFKVNSVYSATNKQQGNAVIAVDNGTNIIWSYHIWVTSHVTGSESIAVQNSKSVLPVPIGWVTTGGKITPKTAVAYARLEQVDNNSVKNVAVMKLELPTIYSCDSNTTGYAAYYQWARKDPFLVSDKYASGYSSNVTAQSNSSTVSTNFANAIKKPGSIIYGAQSSWFRSSSNPTTLWKTSSGSKTIYDPSPSGYMVSDYDALYENSIAVSPRNSSTLGSGRMECANTNTSYSLSDIKGLYIWNNQNAASTYNSSQYYDEKNDVTNSASLVFIRTGIAIRYACWVIPMKTTN